MLEGILSIASIPSGTVLIKQGDVVRKATRMAFISTSTQLTFCILVSMHAVHVAGLQDAFKAVYPFLSSSTNLLLLQNMLLSTGDEVNKSINDRTALITSPLIPVSAKITISVTYQSEASEELTDASESTALLLETLKKKQP